MSYFPVTPNRSGEILAEGISGSAQMKAQAMSGLGQNIGDAISSIASIYADYQGMKAGGKAFKKGMEVLGPAMGIEDTSIFNAMNDIDAYHFSRQFSPAMPSLINLQLGKNNNATRGQSDQNAISRIYTQETLRRERDAINNPPAPAPIAVPTGMRRFN